MSFSRAPPAAALTLKVFPIQQPTMTLRSLALRSAVVVLAGLSCEARHPAEVATVGASTTSSFANTAWNVDFSGTNGWDVALEDAEEHLRLYASSKREELEVEEETASKARDPSKLGAVANGRDLSTRGSQIHASRGGRSVSANFEWAMAVLLAVAVAWYCTNNDCSPRGPDGSSSEGESPGPSPRRFSGGRSRSASPRRGKRGSWQKRRQREDSLKPSRSKGAVPQPPLAETEDPFLQRGRRRSRLKAESDALEGDALVADAFREVDLEDSAFVELPNQGDVAAAVPPAFGIPPPGEALLRTEVEGGPAAALSEADYLAILSSRMAARFLERQEQLAVWLQAPVDPFLDDEGALSSHDPGEALKHLVGGKRFGKRRSLAPPPSPSTPPPSPTEKEGGGTPAGPQRERLPNLSSRLRQRAYSKALAEVREARAEEEAAAAEVDSLVGRVWSQAVNDLRDLGSVLGVLQGHVLLVQTECVRVAALTDLKVVASAVEAEKADALRDLSATVRSPFKRLHCISYEAVLRNLERAHQSLARFRNPEGRQLEGRRIDFVLSQLRALTERTRFLTSSLNARWCELRCLDRNAEDARLRREEKEERAARMQRELLQVAPHVLQGSEALLAGTASGGAGAESRPLPFEDAHEEVLPQEEVARRAEAAISRLAMKVQDLIQLQEALDRVVADLPRLCLEACSPSLFGRLAELRVLLQLLQLQSRAPTSSPMLTPSGDAREVFFVPPSSPPPEHRSSLQSHSEASARGGPTETADSVDDLHALLKDAAALKKRFWECQAQLGRAVRESPLIKLPTSDILIDEVSWIVQAALGWIDADGS